LTKAAGYDVVQCRRPNTKATTTMRNWITKGNRILMKARVSQGNDSVRRAIARSHPYTHLKGESIVEFAS
jgi:hypothetical protein